MISFQELLNELKLTIEYHSKLNPALWHKGQLDESDRKMLIQNALKFVDFSGVKRDSIKDIVFTGSSANFNYTRFSDVDVHVLCDPIGPSDEELHKKKDEWTSRYSDLKLNGYPLEFYIQANARHFPDGQGVFSLLQNKWLVKPVHLDHIDVLEDPKTQVKIEHEISRIKSIIKSNDLDEVKAYKERLSSMRDAGLHRPDKTGGEFSIENVIFKDLRNRGLIDKMRKHYHKLKGEPDSNQEQ